jgi:hypothetical protein
MFDRMAFSGARKKLENRQLADTLVFCYLHKYSLEGARQEARRG